MAQSTPYMPQIPMVPPPPQIPESHQNVCLSKKIQVGVREPTHGRECLGLLVCKFDALTIVPLAAVGIWSRLDNRANCSQGHDAETAVVPGTGTKPWHTSQPDPHISFLLSLSLSVSKQQARQRQARQQQMEQQFKKQQEQEQRNRRAVDLINQIVQTDMLLQQQQQQHNQLLQQQQQQRMLLQHLPMAPVNHS